MGLRIGVLGYLSVSDRFFFFLLCVCGAEKVLVCGPCVLAKTMGHGSEVGSKPCMRFRYRVEEYRVPGLFPTNTNVSDRDFVQECKA